MDVLPPSLISREGDELLRLALWAGNIGFWNWELETNDVYLSPIWKAQLGYEDHELPNAFSTWEKLLHPDDAEHSWKVIQEAQANPERVYEIYFRLRHKQGHYRTLLSRGRVYRDSTGKPIRITGCHVDVTELKRIEEELRQSEAKLQLALLAGDMGTWVWDLEKNEVTLDAKERELFGLPPGNKPFHYEIFNRFVHKDDLERVQNEVNKVLTGNGQLNTEFRIVLPGGEVRWLLGAGSLVRDNETSKPIRMIGINYDITENKMALQAVQGAHEFTKQIIEYAQEGIVVYDRQLRIQVWNRYLEQISNVSARDVLGKTTEEAFPFLKDHVILERIQRPLTGEVVKVKSARFDDPQTGVARWTAAGYAPLRNPQGEIIGVVGTIQEITDRKLEEERVAANNQRMALILDQIPSILWTTDIRLVFTTSTGSGLSVFDLSPELVIGKSLYDYMQTHDPANPTILAHINALKGYSTCYDVEFRGRIFNVTVVPLRSAAGEIIGTIGLAQDITENRKREQEQRELEDRIQQAQKLESLEVLAGGVAHDFNNLLTGMLGYASLAMSELPVNSPVMPMLQGIEKAAQRAAELSRQMLAYSGKGKFVIEAVALDVLVLEMTSLLKTLISPRAQLHVTAEPALIEGDATQIRQVVMNLITNAADAIPPDGMITIRCGSREFNQPELRSDFMQSELNPGPYAYIEVQDNGSGISPENYRKIFDPFFTTKFTGRGLGLASVRGIVRGHGGIIQVKSSQPGGTLFRVILPLKTQNDESPAKEVSAIHPQKPQGTILVVEDDVNVLEFVKIVLQQAGYHVRVTPDSREALTWIEQTAAKTESDLQRADAVLVDYTLPHMSGMELCERIRHLCPELPLLLMSGYTREEVADAMEQLRKIVFLQKPFKPAELLAALETCTQIHP